MRFLPSDELVARGVHRFAREQWFAWKRSQLARGVTPGATPQPGVSHPDIAHEYESLPLAQKDWVTALAYSRVVMFHDLGAAVFDELVAVGRGETALRSELQHQLAKALHDHWYLLRRGLGLKGHAGDKEWDEETPQEQGNDLALVQQLALLLAELSTSEDAEIKAVLACMRGDTE